MRRMQRRRRTVATLSSVALISIGAVAVWSNRGHSPTVSSTITPTVRPMDTSGATSIVGGTSSVPDAPATSATTPPVQNTWTSIAPDPRGVASYPSVVWTGSEALVVGGLDSSGTPRADAAAYDPATNSWRVLADPPSGGHRINPLVAWTGTEMLVIGGDNPDRSLLVSYGEAYDPATDTWRVTASPPVGFVSERSPAVWTGTELLVWPWDGGGTTMPITPIAYDPVTDTWRELPQPPIERRQQAATVWTGTEWIVWGGTTGQEEVDDGAAYDPAADSWRVIAASPLSARRVRAVWTGTEMFVDAGSTGGDRQTGNGEMALADGAAYDPVADTWRTTTPGLAHPGFVPVWTGRQVVMFAKGNAAVYDVAADRWIDTGGEAGGQAGGGVGAAPVWTGSSVLLIGSPVGDVGGAVFTPPA